MFFQLYRFSCCLWGLMILFQVWVTKTNCIPDNYSMNQINFLLYKLLPKTHFMSNMTLISVTWIWQNMYQNILTVFEFRNTVRVAKVCYKHLNIRNVCKTILPIMKQIYKVKLMIAIIRLPFHYPSCCWFMKNNTLRLYVNRCDS